MSGSRFLTSAGRFHGHIGPFLAIGLKMGMVANERLGRAPMKTHAVVRVRTRPPRSCVVDGLQYSTGCTTGKQNIVVEPDEHAVEVTFRRGESELTVRLREEFLKKMESEISGAEEKAIIDYSYQIMDTSLEKILEVRE